MNLTTEDFNYNLPDELIANYPLKKREDARMMVLHKNSKTLEHKHFFDIVDYLKKDDDADGILDPRDNSSLMDRDVRIFIKNTRIYADYVFNSDEEDLCK